MWGSSDGSKTIKTKKKMKPIMEEVAKQLRLAKHSVVELSSGKTKIMIGPVDVKFLYFFFIYFLFLFSFYRWRVI